MTESICINCKKIFRTFPSHLKKGGGKFCSNKCYGEYRSKFFVGEKASSWKGGITKNLRIYNALRRDKNQTKAISDKRTAFKNNKIQKGQCFFCGNPETMAHHYDYSKSFNIIWLCKKCHGRLHLVLRLYGFETKNRSTPLMGWGKEGKE